MCSSFGVVPRMQSCAVFVVRAETSESPHARNACGVTSIVKVLPPVEPRGFEPRTSAVQRRRSPG
jgi:hypothetical protein